MRSGTPDTTFFFKAWILSLGLFLLFFPGCTPEAVETELLLPVDFSNVPEDMVLTDFLTDKIAVRIKGDPRDIDRFQKETLIYPADIYTDIAFDPAGDIDSIETGAYVLPVEKNRVPLDPSVTILGISPAFLSIRLEKKVTKNVKVVTPYTGEPAKGYLALAPALDPPLVALTGPKSRIEAVSTLSTKPVDLSAASETFKKEVPLDLDPALSCSPTPGIFIVTVPIQPELRQRTIENLPIRLVHAKGKVSITPDRISIEVKGPMDTLNNKGVTDKIHAFMDLAGLTHGVHARHACIDVPVDLIMTSATPQVFTVKIE